jgi:branched-chain amino acid transport system ATP-binding protein
MPEVETINLSKNFDAVVALRDVSIKMQGPGIFGILGPNGSGKSTLLGVLSGFVEPTAGLVRINGSVVTKTRPDRYAGAGVARTFQISRLVDDLRVWENIAIAVKPIDRSFLGWGSQRRLYKAVWEITEPVGLTQVLDRWPADLTAAERRKVEVLRALAAKASVILLDEPTAGLSDADALSLVPIIHEAAQSSLVIIVEHNLQLIYSVAPAVVVLVNGSVVAEGDPRAVVSIAAVKSAYLGPG